MSETLDSLMWSWFAKQDWSAASWPDDPVEQRTVLYLYLSPHLGAPVEYRAPTLNRAVELAWEEHGRGEDG